VNVTDLFALAFPEFHSHGLSREDFVADFTEDRPVVMSFHGYASAVHQMLHRRPATERFHVRGYIEEGTTTTPFDMVMLNNLDRFHLVTDVIDRVPQLGERAARLRQDMVDKRLAARAWTREYGEDLPEVTEWKWSAS
jgi:xylulose-5-phosphate/fructose-6-phosphate phosphoketolase